jgi:hypothetical protein
MKKAVAKKERPSTVKRPAKKSATEQKQEGRLTDRYASAARKNEQRPGDELSELEPVGRKRPS